MTKSSTFDWYYYWGLYMASLNRLQIARALKRDKIKDYTLDIDATQIIAEKTDAKWTYKGERGYMPIVGHLAENGLVVAEAFREGNTPPADRNLDFFKTCLSQMPKGSQIKNYRADSASYQADVFNLCEEKGIKLAIGGRQDQAVKEQISSLPESCWENFEDGAITEIVHSMNETDNAFRLIILRRPAQSQLFTDKTPSFGYTLIASNRKESVKETVLWYRKRGDASAYRIKDLKIGFGMERMPCGDFSANAVFFRLGVLAYNLFVLFKILALPGQWRRSQVQTLRWRLYQVVGKVICHARAQILKINRRFYALFESIRARMAEVACL